MLGGSTLIFYRQWYNLEKSSIREAKLPEGGANMNGLLGVGGLIGGIITLIIGIIILVWPRIIAYVIGIWLIIVGILAIIAALQ